MIMDCGPQGRIDTELQCPACLNNRLWQRIESSACEDDWFCMMCRRSWPADAVLTLGKTARCSLVLSESGSYYSVWSVCEGIELDNDGNPLDDA